jgi:hypothetical protein
VDDARVAPVLPEQELPPEGMAKRLFDVIGLSYRAVGPGATLSVLRFRRPRFQLQVASVSAGHGLTPAFMDFWIGALGVGARFPYDPE